MRLLLLHNNIQKQPTRYIKRLASSSTTTTTATKSKRPEFGRYQFLTPGFQPTAIIGDNIGFYHGSTFFEGVPPDTLPILDTSVILSPGRYCKKSSWSTSHHRHKGTRSGVDAAQRLVDARRDFFHLIQNELSNIEMEDSSNNSTRKIYAITGHGVPTSLIQHMIHVARSWLLLYHPSSSSTTNNKEEKIGHRNKQSLSSMNNQILFTNQHNSTLLNQDQIRIIDMHGITQTLPSLPNEWKDDLELYMVVMHRIGSRLASMAMPNNIINNNNAYLFDSNNNIDDVDDGDNTYVGKPEKMNDTLVGIGSSSVVTPSQLKRWNVTIIKGESLPSSLLPGCNINNVDKGNDKRRKQGGEGNLTIEWKKKRNDCWNVVLRLQDEGQSDRECPISLVFDGEYIPP